MGLIDPGSDDSEYNSDESSEVESEDESSSESCSSSKRKYGPTVIVSLILERKPISRKGKMQIPLA